MISNQSISRSFIQSLFSTNLSWFLLHLNNNVKRPRSANKKKSLKESGVNDKCSIHSVKETRISSSFRVQHSFFHFFIRYRSFERTESKAEKYNSITPSSKFIDRGSPPFTNQYSFFGAPVCCFFYASYSLYVKQKRIQIQGTKGALFFEQLRHRTFSRPIQASLRPGLRLYTLPLSAFMRGSSMIIPTRETIIHIPGIQKNLFGVFGDDLLSKPSSSFRK